MAEERILQLDGEPVRVQTIGDPGDPALLLLGDAGSASDWWDADSGARLAAGLRFLIRYDGRDTASSPAQAAADAIRILDALGIGRAHLIGASTSAAQAVAVRHSDRVESLTLIATAEPAGAGFGQIGARTLIVHDPAGPQVAQAEALGRQIRAAELLPLAGVTHRMQTWAALIPALLRHTSGGWDEQADRLAHRSLAAGDPTGWFDRIYTAGATGEVPMPWDRTGPHPLLAEWAQGRSGTGRRAVVVGCGLGADAEFLAGLGFDTTAFDISETAVGIARKRHPDSCVDYQVASLLDLPEEWAGAFDLVVEIYTVQALPEPPRNAAIPGVGTLLARDGTLLVIQMIHDENGTGHGPP